MAVENKDVYTLADALSFPSDVLCVYYTSKARDDFRLMHAMTLWNHRNPSTNHDCNTGGAAQNESKLPAAPGAASAAAQALASARI